LAKQAAIKQNKAQAIIEQVASVAEGFLTVINCYDIEKNLSKQVIHDVEANIYRMTS
jgi:serine/threonine-protein kinase HipA